MLLGGGCAAVRNRCSNGKYDTGITAIKGRTVKFDAQSPEIIPVGSQGETITHWHGFYDRGMSWAEAKKVLESLILAETENEKVQAQGTGKQGFTDMRKSSKLKITGFWCGKQKCCGEHLVLLACRRLTTTAFMTSKCRIWRPGMGEQQMDVPDLTSKYTQVSLPFVSALCYSFLHTSFL